MARYLECMAYTGGALNPSEKTKRGKKMMSLVKAALSSQEAHLTFSAEMIAHSIPAEFARTYASYRAFLSAISACLRHLRDQGSIKKVDNASFQLVSPQNRKAPKRDRAPADQEKGWTRFKVMTAYVLHQAIFEEVVSNDILMDEMPENLKEMYPENARLNGLLEAQRRIIARDKVDPIIIRALKSGKIESIVV